MLLKNAVSQDMEVEEYVKLESEEATPRAMSTREVEEASRKVMSFRIYIKDKSGTNLVRTTCRFAVRFVALDTWCCLVHGL